MPDSAPVNPAGTASAEASDSDQDTLAPEGEGEGSSSAAPAGQESRAPAVAKPAPEGIEKTPEKPRFKFKAKTRGDDGQETEQEIEAGEDEIREWRETSEKRREHLRAANERMAEAAKQREQLRSFVEQAKQDPWALLEQLGIDPTQAAVQRLQAEVAKQEMTPEQRAQTLREQQLADRERRIQDAEAKQAEADGAQKAEGFKREFGKKLGEVLPKFGLPDDAITAGEMGKLIAAQIRGGYEEPDYEAAADLLAERNEKIVKAHLDRLGRTPGALARQYPELAKQLREEDVASATAPRARPGKPGTAPRQTPEARQMTWRDEEAEFRKRHYGI